jgi:hypothetical protein
MDPKVEVAIDLANQTLTLPDGRKIEFAVDTFSKTHVARCAARYIDRRPTRMEVVATKTAGFALFSIDYFVINASLPR